MTFPEKLKDLRKSRNLKQKEVAEAINLTVNAISNYEQGLREPSLTVLKDICLFFDVSADYLVGITDEY